MSKVEDRLAAQGVTLPQPVAPVANYVPFVRVGGLVHISGQVSLDASGGVRGIVGEDVDIEAIAEDDNADVQLMHGWRRELFGDLALSIKRGEAVIGFEKGRVRVIPAADRAMKEAAE